MVTKNVNIDGGVVLVTGAAGFIGANLVKRLLKRLKFYNNLLPYKLTYLAQTERQKNLPFNLNLIFLLYIFFCIS